MDPLAAVTDALSSPLPLAYIGPGAGFALIGSFFVVFLTLLALVGTLIRTPIRLLRALIRGRRGGPKGPWKRVVVVGMDGMDPKLARQYMEEGRMPNFSRLADRGTFLPLGTSMPSMSPTAWSSFMTGVDASRHGIFDFLTRDPRNYLPALSSAEVLGPKRQLKLGDRIFPLGKPRVKLLRKGIPFWKRLGDKGIFSTVIRVPITFPPEAFHGTCLSGMCVPDLRGSQGTFTHFTSVETKEGEHVEGVTVRVKVQGRRIDTAFPGPTDPTRKKGKPLESPMTIILRPEKDEAELRVGGERVVLKKGKFSDWVRVPFRAAPGIKVKGIARFHVNSLAEPFDMYASPIQIDPAAPALPISHPFVYAVYMAKRIGTYGTLGLAEDTWALNEGVIDEEAFLEQAYLYHDEREKMLFDAMEKNRSGVVVCVFDSTDRIQHMFFRTLDDDHPANRGREVEKYRSVIPELYEKTDEMLARVEAALRPDDLLIVMSDHGFARFKRGVNFNAWLRDEGYLTLKEGATSGGDWFEGVDWGHTRAFSLGLAGIFINRKGRERDGIVEADDVQALKDEIRQKLLGLVDPETGGRAIKEVYDTDRIMDGPYTRDAPDLLIGFEGGYRISWGGATGRVPEEVFEDNTKHWSGDHCVDPSLVPGVFFCNEKVEAEELSLIDLAPTLMKIFGQPIPGHIQGKAAEVKKAPVAAPPAGVAAGA